MLLALLRIPSRLTALDRLHFGRYRRNIRHGGNAVHFLHGIETPPDTFRPVAIHLFPATGAVSLRGPRPVRCR